MNTAGGIVGIVTCLLKSALLVYYILAIKTGPTVIGCALFRLKHVIQLQTSVRTSGKNFYVREGKLECVPFQMQQGSYQGSEGFFKHILLVRVAIHVHCTCY